MGQRLGETIAAAGTDQALGDDVGGYDAVFQRRGHPHQGIPLLPDQIQVHGTAEERPEAFGHLHTGRCVELLRRQVL